MRRAVSDREAMLTRIRAALNDVPAGEPSAWEVAEDPDPASRYERTTTRDGAELAALFAARCSDYRATVRRCPDRPAAIAEAIAAAATAHGARELVTAPGFPAPWLPDSLSVRKDTPPLEPRELDEFDGVISTCALAVATTGTIVLDGSPGQGRRVLTLVPDLHICVVLSTQIVFGIPEAITRVSATPQSASRPLTWISGPSATSDIELQRVEGVHGPRNLEVVLCGG
jgi:L-lactate dehydrogenase complex protein LldG